MCFIKIEGVPTFYKKKQWIFAKGTSNALITFTADDFANFEYLKGLSTNKNKRINLMNWTKDFVANFLPKLKIAEKELLEKTLKTL